PPTPWRCGGRGGRLEGAAQKKEKTMKPEQPSYDWRTDPLLGAQHFDENRSKFPVEQLIPYAGQTIAWYPDGSGIAGADPDGHALWKRLREAGEDPSNYVFEDIPPLDHGGYV